MSLGTILLMVVIVALVGVLPIWPHASSWGYGPSGLVGVVLLILIVPFVMDLQFPRGDGGVFHAKEKA